MSATETESPGRSPRSRTAAAAREIAGAAICAAAFVVPLIYAPALAAPFTVAKHTILELGGALGLGALLLRLVAGDQDGIATGEAAWRDRLMTRTRPLHLGIGLVLGSVALSAAIADRAPGAPYAASSLVRWLALFGISCGVVASTRAAASAGGATTPARVLQSVTASAALVSVIGLLQHLDVLALPIPVISTPGSTFGNRNLGAEAVALSLPFGLGCLALSRGRRSERRVIAAALLLEILYLAATRARGAWLGGVMGLLVYALASGKPWSRPMVLRAFAVGVLAVLVAVIPGRLNPRYAADAKRFAPASHVVGTSFDPDSPALRTRLGLWRRSLSMFATHPVVGIGPGNWPVLFPRYAEPGATTEGVLSASLAPRNAHCDLVECLTETGLIGLGSLVILAAGVARMLRRGLRASGDSPGRLSTRIAAATLVALVGVSLTGFPLEMPGTVMLGGLALGLTAWGDECEVPEPSGPFRGAQAPGTSPSQPTSRAPRPWTRLRPWLTRGSAWLSVVVLLALSLNRAQQRVRGSYWLGVGERALRQDPGRSGAEQALPALASSLAAEPTFKVALRMAQAWLRVGLYLDATRACDAANAIEPYSPNAWATLAAVQLEAGDPRSAWLSARRSLDLLDDGPLALSVAARAAQALARDADAQAMWNHLLTLAGRERADHETARSAEELLAARPAPVSPAK